MPNIAFYALDKDFDLVLGYIFKDSGCRVFESYSPFGADLAEFDGLSSIASRYSIGRCVGDASSVLLTLVPANAMRLCHVRRIELNPMKCDGHTFRYAISGWGVIVMNLGGIGPKGLVPSQSSHNTVARARSWENMYKNELGSIDVWDWDATIRISAALNRFINKRAVYKLGSRPVLLGAAKAFLSGSSPVARHDVQVLKQVMSAGVTAKGSG